MADLESKIRTHAPTRKARWKLLATVTLLLSQARNGKPFVRRWWGTHLPQRRGWRQSTRSRPRARRTAATKPKFSLGSAMSPWRSMKRAKSFGWPGGLRNEQSPQWLQSGVVAGRKGHLFCRGEPALLCKTKWRCRAGGAGGGRQCARPTYSDAGRPFVRDVIEVLSSALGAGLNRPVPHP